MLSRDFACKADYHVLMEDLRYRAVDENISLLNDLSSHWVHKCTSPLSKFTLSSLQCTKTMKVLQWELLRYTSLFRAIAASTVFAQQDSVSPSCFKGLYVALINDWTTTVGYNAIMLSRIVGIVRIAPLGLIHS